MKKAILYVHGKGGSAAEAEFYRDVCPDSDVIGVEYTDYLPWIAGAQVREAYDRIKADYDEISIITNSIGTLFSMLALQDCEVKKAYCISPILNMERLITDMMGWAGVSEDELREKKEINTDFGETLSWDYLCYIRSHPINWRIPTSVLYADGDTLTSRRTVDEFIAAHNANLTVMEGGEHWFHTDEQLAFLTEWLIREQKNT